MNTLSSKEVENTINVIELEILEAIEDAKLSLFNCETEYGFGEETVKEIITDLGTRINEIMKQNM